MDAWHPDGMLLASRYANVLSKLEAPPPRLTPTRPFSWNFSRNAPVFLGKLREIASFGRIAPVFSGISADMRPFFRETSRNRDSGNFVKISRNFQKNRDFARFP